MTHEAITRRLMDTKNFDERPHRREWKFFVGKIWCNTWLLPRPVNQNADKQPMLEILPGTVTCSAACRKIPTSSLSKVPIPVGDQSLYVIHKSVCSVSSLQTIAYLDLISRFCRTLTCPTVTHRHRHCHTLAHMSRNVMASVAIGRIYATCDAA